MFAAYLIDYPTYGTSAADYRREISEAQSIGIDGFAVSVTEWSSATEEYRQRVRTLFQASDDLGSGFVLFLSADMCCGLSARDIVDMAGELTRRRCYLKMQGRPVLTTFIGQDLGMTFWSDGVLKPLRAAGVAVLFVPHFFVERRCRFADTACSDFNTPSQSEIESSLGKWSNVVDGLRYSAVAASETDLAASGEAYASVLARHAKVYFASVSPSFWIGRTVPDLPRRYYETHGGEGVATQWISLIDRQRPSAVIIETWNDYTESYLSPADPSQMPLKGSFWNVGRLIKPHVGYARLFKYFIGWYKNGKPPSAEDDELFVFYRTHAKDAVATQDQNPVYQYGSVLDDVYVTSILVHPAILVVHSGAQTTSRDLPAGMAHNRIPFFPGEQRFELRRKGSSILAINGEPVRSRIAQYNFFSTTGFAADDAARRHDH